MTVTAKKQTTKSGDRERNTPVQVASPVTSSSQTPPPNSRSETMLADPTTFHTCENSGDILDITVATVKPQSK